MALHTIVIEVPDTIHAPLIEAAVTKAIENATSQWMGIRPQVVEYHHEQITTTEQEN